jgi:hypothetical protein
MGDDYVTFTDIEDYLRRRGYGNRNITNLTAYGSRASVHKMIEKRERFELKWEERTRANSIHSELRTLYDAVSGDANPFVFMPDVTLTDVYYMVIENPELLYNEIHGVGSEAHVGGFMLRLLEEVRGKV